jgi:lauroyl/myristoyl acyltransferase
METAIRAAMFKMLFPWAYCRFTRCPEELERWVHVRGLELLTPLLGTGRGILLACNHLGPAHMIEYFMAAQGYQFYAMQRDTCTHHWRMRYAVPGLNTRIKKIFIKQDLSPGLLQTTIKIRDLLHRGEIVMAVLDGSSGKSEIRLSLMGCERAFRIAMPLIASLARAIIVPVYATLQADGHIEIRFEAPLPEQSPDQAPLDYARDIMRKYVARLQSHWETEPGNVKVTMLANRMNYK